jgi:hypothetical protein
MPIPEQITAFHIAKAIQDLKKMPIDSRRGSTKYCINVEGISLEPKRIISRAAFYAIGRELKPEEFNGGNESNDFLAKFGFKTNLGATKS